jgi:hypothetical protein
MKNDSKKLIKIIQKITNEKPKIWGNNNFIGFGNYKYSRKGSKEELEWFKVGLAPRKDKISLYVTCYLNKEPLVEKLGKCKWGKGCIYIKKLDDINLDVLEKLIRKYKNTSWY